MIPRAPTTLLATRTERSAPPVLASRPVSGTGSRPGRRPRRLSEPDARYYRVKRGDTLFSIARLFNTTVESIKSLNRLRGNALTVGKTAAGEKAITPNSQRQTPKELTADRL